MVANDDPFAAMSLLEAGTPLPPEDGPVYAGASLAAPPVVIPASPSAVPYAYVAPQRRAPRPNASVGADSLTPILLLCLIVGMVGITIYRMTEISDLADQGMNPVAIAAMKKLAWTVTITFTVAHFIIVAPLCMLAVFIGSKIMNFELPGSPYLRAAGVASLPLVAAMGIQVLAPDNLTVRLILIVAILPLGFYVLKHIFELTLTEALVSYAFTIVFFLIGLFLSVLLSGAVAAAGIADSKGDIQRAMIEQRRQEQQERYDQQRSERYQPRYGTSTGDTGGETSSDGGNSEDNSYRPPPVDPMQMRANSLQQRLQSLQSRNFDHQSRESAMRDLAPLEAEIARAPAEMKSRPEWPSIQSLAQSVRQKLAALPSEEPDPDIFKPMPAGTPFAPPANGVAALDEEITFDKFALRPPAGAKLDLRESSAKDLRWGFEGSSSGDFSLSVVPRKNPRQQRPWLATRSFHTAAAERDNLFHIQSAVPGQITFGTLADLPAAKVEGETIGSQRFVQYVLLDGDRWIVFRLQSRGSNGAAMDLFDLAARTLRPMKANEPKADPFAPERIASRLGEDPQTVSALLRKQPAVAEPIVLGLLNSDDSSTRRAAADLLPLVTSPKSLPQLKILASHADRHVAETVRALLRKLDPSFDTVAEALLDLKAENYTERRNAMDLLAKTPPDPKRQNEVAGLLEAILAPENMMGSEADAAAAALAVWPGERTATRLAPLLNNPGLSGSRRDALLTAISGTRDRVAVNVVMKWLPLETDRVSQILIGMGPIAEDETVRVLSLYFTNNTADGPKVRAACVNILSEIGSAKSLEVLGRASRDRRDLVAQAAAKQAIERVKERAAATPATKPATKPS